MAEFALFSVILTRTLTRLSESESSRWNPWGAKPFYYLETFPSLSRFRSEGLSKDPAGVSAFFVVAEPAAEIASTAFLSGAAGTVSGGINVYNQGPATANVIIDMNGFFAAPSDLSGNTAIGVGTLASNTTGVGNTASGVNALNSNTPGTTTWPPAKPRYLAIPPANFLSPLFRRLALEVAWLPQMAR